MRAALRVEGLRASVKRRTVGSAAGLASLHNLWRWLLPALTLLLLAGCSMTNDEIIAETKKCEEAGLDAVGYIRAIPGTIEHIQCHPRRHCASRVVERTER